MSRLRLGLCPAPGTGLDNQPRRAVNSGHVTTLCRSGGGWCARLGRDAVRSASRTISLDDAELDDAELDDAELDDAELDDAELDDAELDDAEAAGLPLAGLIAWQSLVDIAAITAGDRGPDPGGSRRGRQPGRPDRQARGRLRWYRCAGWPGVSRRVGVDQPIDYTSTNVVEVPAVDVILDLVGGAVAMASVPVLRDGGLLISVPSAADLQSLRAALLDVFESLESSSSRTAPAWTR
jgi:NADPH:quinone reductase-like Zn-dependent oxidoreductase